MILDVYIILYIFFITISSDATAATTTSDATAVTTSSKATAATTTSDAAATLVGHKDL